MTSPSANPLVRRLLLDPLARDRERIGSDSKRRGRPPGLRSAALPVSLRVRPRARLGVEPSGLGGHPRLRSGLPAAHRAGGDRAVILVDVEQLYPFRPI